MRTKLHVFTLNVLLATAKNGKLKLKVDDGELSARRNRYGFFGVFTNHKELSDRELIMTYKTKDLIEKGFEVLKSELEVFPISHSRDDRIETHIVLVIYGYFLLSLLRAILDNKGVEFRTRRTGEETSYNASK